MEYLSGSVANTQNFAKSLGKKALKQGMVLALTGDLGAGKTTFAQGFARGLNITGKIISPTFTIIRQHPVPKQRKTFYHIDLYRIESGFDQLGLKEIFENIENIILIEWAEKVKTRLPKNTTFIQIIKLSDTERKITVSH